MSQQDDIPQNNQEEEVTLSDAVTFEIDQEDLLEATMATMQSDAM